MPLFFPIIVPVSFRLFMLFFLPFAIFPLLLLFKKEVETGACKASPPPWSCASQ